MQVELIKVSLDGKTLSNSLPVNHSCIKINSEQRDEPDGVSLVLLLMLSLNKFLEQHSLHKVSLF